MSKLISSLFQSLLDSTLKVHSSIENRSDFRSFRVCAMEELSQRKIKKLAFDSRRTNQYVDYNPRRNLQYYHRSEPFLTKDASEKIKTFFKLKIVADQIKEDFEGDNDYFDSYCRILSSALDRVLRIKEADMDFSKPQLDYIDELLYLRYRLKDEDINKLAEKDLRNILLDRDEKLLHKQIFANYNNGGLNKQSKKENENVIVNGKDNLIEKLFGDVKASKENKNVKRTITISIDDSIKDDLKKEGRDGK